MLDEARHGTARHDGGALSSRGAQVAFGVCFGARHDVSERGGVRMSERRGVRE